MGTEDANSFSEQLSGSGNGSAVGGVPNGGGKEKMLGELAMCVCV